MFSSSSAGTTTTTIIPNHSLPGVTPIKPKRPLTAYHLFLQLEREYMIQTSVGEVENKSMFVGKTILEDAPQRYKNIKLPPDWYAGPGKRKKRRHRKSHGMFSFLDLSRVIAASWKELPTSDPETLSFVQKIAKSELEKYYQEMKEYKELIKCIDLCVFNDNTNNSVTVTPHWN